MRGQPVHIEEARRARNERAYREALRSIGDIARRGIRGHGENRFHALATIDRISAKALNENS